MPMAMMRSWNEVRDAIRHGPFEAPEAAVYLGRHHGDLACSNALASSLLWPSRGRQFFLLCDSHIHEDDVTAPEFWMPALAKLPWLKNRT